MNPTARRAIIFGVANERSLAWGIAKSLHASGVSLILTYASQAYERRVRPLAEQIGAEDVIRCDVRSDEEIAAAFARIAERWNTVDIVVHSIAFADINALAHRLLDVSRTAFLEAMDVSVYSFIALARHAASLMVNGGALLTLTNSGSQRVIPHYHLMGAAKASLESSVRYLADELGPQKIRVNAISSGPIRTYSSMAIHGFPGFLDDVEKRSPLRANVGIDDVGALAAFLCSDGARHITGTVIPVDSGIQILGA
jgi:enoyl-[acyl-carrier protein] reductase I